LFEPAQGTVGFFHISHTVIRTVSDAVHARKQAGLVFQFSGIGKNVIIHDQGVQGFNTLIAEKVRGLEGRIDQEIANFIFLMRNHLIFTIYK
jgi:hypothetical protein